MGGITHWFPWELKDTTSCSGGGRGRGRGRVTLRETDDILSQFQNGVT